MMNQYGFPLCIQLTPPENFLEDRDFADTMELLQKWGFYGVELNIVDFVNTDPEKLKRFLENFGLRLTMIATGVFAKKNKLSLSSADEAVRKQTVRAFDQIVPFAETLDAGIICGFIKGGSEGDQAAAKRKFKISVDELKEKFGNSSSCIYLEATNHYEAAVMNLVSDGVGFLGEDLKNMRILPDTYHMNIEESSISAAMIKYADFYRNIHISDNNRYFPGFGAIDFYQILSVLKGMHYQGTMAIEGRNLYSLYEDIKRSCRYLANVADRIDLERK